MLRTLPRYTIRVCPPCHVIPRAPSDLLLGRMPGFIPAISPYLTVLALLLHSALHSTTHSRSQLVSLFPMSLCRCASVCSLPAVQSHITLEFPTFQHPPLLRATCSPR